MVVKTTPPEATWSFSRDRARSLGLDGRLPQNLLAAGEGPEELVVQIVAVGEDHDRRVVHGRDGA